MRVQEIPAEDLDALVAKALGHIGQPLPFHLIPSVAFELYRQHGTEMKKFKDGHYATMGHGAVSYTMHDPEPDIAIYRAFIATRMGDEV